MQVQPLEVHLALAPSPHRSIAIDEQTAFLSRNNVPVIDLDADELAAAIDTVAELAAQLENDTGA